METYKHSRKCPKCGQSYINDVFYKEGERYCDNFFKYSNEDIIRRTCQNCHYSWNEKALEGK